MTGVLLQHKMFAITYQHHSACKKILPLTAVFPSLHWALNPERTKVRNTPERRRKLIVPRLEMYIKENSLNEMMEIPLTNMLKVG